MALFVSKTLEPSRRRICTTASRFSETSNTEWTSCEPPLDDDVTALDDDFAVLDEDLASEVLEEDLFSVLLDDDATTLDDYAGTLDDDFAMLEELSSPPSLRESFSTALIAWMRIALMVSGTAKESSADFAAVEES